MADTEPNPVLCTSCRSLCYQQSNNNLLHRCLDNRYVVPMAWHSSINELKDAAESGCSLCAEVWFQVLALDRPKKQFWPLIANIEVVIGVESEPSHKAEYASGSVAQLWYFEFLAVMKSVGEFVAYDGISFPFGKHYLIPLEPFKSSVSLSETRKSSILAGRGLGLAREWLTTCREEHSSCNSSRSRPRSLPSRLIEIYEPGEARKARLVDSRDLPPDTCYLTLSHRWGTGPLYLLRSDNVEQLRKDVQLDQIPRTFQDAIEVTEFLGYRHIWIDSLCIVQDSLDDWAMEVQRMADVYENAMCNLAAIGSTSSTKGLNIRNAKGRAVQTVVSVDFKVNKSGLKGKFGLVPQESWSSRVLEAPLNRRGWVLQERVLSPRVLYFGHDQLLWECQELRASGTWTLGLDPHISVIDMQGVLSYHSMLRVNGQEQEEEARRTWYHLLRLYTVCDLTIESDKLPAFAGIISRFQDLLSDTAMFGLWRKTLMRDLLWFDDTLLLQTTATRAPSWSWASVDCAIFRCLEVVPVALVAESDSIEGDHIASGAQGIRIRAPMLKADCSTRFLLYSSQNGTARSKQTTLDLRFRFDGRPGDFDGIAGTDRDASGTIHKAELAECHPSLIRAYLLFISKEPIAGLILRRLPGLGLFARIGYFDNFFSGLDDRVPSLPLEPYLDDTLDFARDDYHENHGRGVFTVTIV